MSATIIFGPPGTGKTTELMARLEHELASGLPPERIAFVSFTKAAVNEAVSRATERFKYNKKQFFWFRTLHSMCFAALRIDRESMLTDYTTFAANSGLRLSASRGELVADASEGDKFLSARSLCAATGLTFNKVQHRYGIELGSFRYERLSRMLDDYKAQLGLIEYQDLLIQFLLNCKPLDVDVAFIDEAQDLTPTQWRVVAHAFKNVRQIYVAGDDDQAIYEWAGADPLHMLHMDGSRETLERSYRLSPAHVALAMSLSSRIKTRQMKDWRSADPKRKGEVTHWFNWNDLDFDGTDTWMILARANQYLPSLARTLEQQGISYTWCGAPRIKQANARLFTHMKELLAGKQVRGSNVLKLLEESGSNVRSITLKPHEPITINAPGMKQVAWLAKWPRQRIAYFERVWARYGTLLDAPIVVELTTIHQAKGAEADNVVVCPDVTPTIWRNGSDSEHRVWYVAVTRSKRRLFVLRPSQEHFYRVA